MSGSRIRPYLGPLIAVLVILALGVGTVYAAIPNPTNKKFYACFVKKTGDVRLIDYPSVSTCPKGQRLVNWNAKGPVGPQGPQGLQGVQGVQGPVGAPGNMSIRVTRVNGGEMLIDPLGTGAVTADCPAGSVVTGGGFMAAGDVNIYLSRAYDADTWEVMATNPSTGTRGLKAYAYCMATDPAGVITTAKVKVAKKRSR